MDTVPQTPNYWASRKQRGSAVACRPGVLAEGCSEGAQNRAAPGPQAAAPRGLGGRKGKGDVIAAWNLLFGGVAMETGRLRVGKNSKPKRV